MNVMVPLLRGERSGAVRRRRTIAVDTAIVLSAAAALAHLVVAPGHFTWWATAGLFFVVLGVAQLLYSVVLVRFSYDQRLVQAGIWGTVGVILLYVASRTVGLPNTPPVPIHGGRWVPGRSILADGAKHVGPLDVFTLVAEILLVVTLVSMLPARSRRRTANGLMWIGLALWGTSFALL